MLPSSSTSSTPSKKSDAPPRPGTPSVTQPPTGDLAEQSDVPCYTCRRRHVKCDRMLPTCAKCAKKGVPCLGYQKPLRWAEGVAVRGKLKGKSRPVVDSTVVTIVQNTMELQTDSAVKEAAHSSFPNPKDTGTENLGNDGLLQELMAYHNSTICAENVSLRESRFIDRAIAPLSNDTMQKLPRAIVHGVLANAAVHMASRQPADRRLERLALEAKVHGFQSFNALIQSPQNQQPDVIIAAGILVFAMDLVEHGMSRWMIHCLGTLQVISSFGGIENLFNYYPHLQLPLIHMAHFETLWIMLSHIPITKPKQSSRRALEMLCTASRASRKFYNPCPEPLTLAIWDIGACATRLLGKGQRIKPTDLHKREQILQDVLAFRHEEAARDVQEKYYSGDSITDARLRHGNSISLVWKGAITILVLRYLYFGRHELAPTSQLAGSSIDTQSTGSSSSRGKGPLDFQSIEEYPFNEYLEETESPESLHDHLSAGMYLHDALSRSPSPMPSPVPSSTMAPTNFWQLRYQIHDEAFASLADSLFFIHDDLDPACIRHIILPLLILALVSRRDSNERELCLSYFRKYREHMAANYPPNTASSPQGGEQMTLDIPWERLDAYSAEMQRVRRGTLTEEGSGLSRGAPEWNWWDALNHLRLNFIFMLLDVTPDVSRLLLPIAASIITIFAKSMDVSTWTELNSTAGPLASGTSIFERGSEFWAFNLISSVVNEEIFSAWLNTPAATTSA
ncbi:hypothetical protein K491DRAFT_681981 [Lophiostoma macrostomum CBS 122681]|uniref:Zn(2)-C6 fungal-type domain-containing protein n=1 Tax=Lophiostoma macrostomum CBS 122681 TaxID=1314788 RepID=A0A6A6SVA8_9PLEO|nr:hypothetical protein K491DRAFT_681981 [Lophiostoma macrostomum CBS 122681]